MKVFDQIKGFEDKVNFVDENNVVVGYNLYASCCERAGYFFSDKEDESIRDGDYYLDDDDIHYKNVITEETLEKYVFDAEYCKYGDSVVIFKLISNLENYNPVYLYLYNIHNGYYAHGFAMKKDGIPIVDDTI